MLSTTPRAGATVGIEGARLVLPGRCRRCRPRRVAAKAKQSALPSELSDLLEIASRTQRGEGLTTVDREAMERACDSLVASTDPKSVVSRSTLSKTWRLVLTTEKETLFITSNLRKFFGLGAEVKQIIDLESGGAGSLQNLIAWGDDGGAFVVNSSLSLEETGGRANFKFTDARLVLGRSLGKIALPPFGQGWFDTIYQDKRYRLARDSRDDILLVENVGEPDFYQL